MSSERRLQSSRANGAKSRGPKTAKGKFRSAKNALRHGLLARSVVLDDENAESFNSLLTGLENTFQPQDEFERLCVESLAVSSWQSMRIWGMENANLAHEMAKQEDSGLNPPVRAALAFRSLSDGSSSADLIGRYATRHNRQISRAFNLMLKWREHRRADCQTNPVPKTDTQP